MDADSTSILNEPLNQLLTVALLNAIPALPLEQEDATAVKSPPAAAPSKCNATLNASQSAGERTVASGTQPTQEDRQGSAASSNVEGVAVASSVKTTQRLDKEMAAAALEIVVEQVGS